MISNRKINIYLLLAVLTTAAGCAKKPSEVPVRNFMLETPDRERFYLNEYKGRPIVLMFWTTWCSICKVQMNQLPALIENTLGGGREAVLVAVCADPENIDAAGLSFPKEITVLLDRNASVTRNYGIKAFPTTIIIDRSFETTFFKEGYGPRTSRQISSALQSAAAESR